MAVPVLIVAALPLVYFLFRLLNATDVPRIKNLPEIPGVPIFGNLLQLGVEHARVAGQWAKKYGPVFQARLGNRVRALSTLSFAPILIRQRVIFVNSYDTVKHFWITHQSSLISRPTFHTFHSVVSTSQGFTIGTSPWDESCKQRRKAAATALNRPAVKSYMPILDLESTASIGELLDDSKGGTVDLNPTLYFNRFALNTSLTLNYGFRIDGNVDDKLLNEIVHVERVVSNFRSTSNNWQDYVPLMRLWSTQNSEAKEYRARRDAYLSLLLDTLKKNVSEGTDKPCITGNILKDPEAKLNDAEIKSICLTMVSAGIDTVPANLVMCIAYLSSPHGQEIQKKALKLIEEVYPNGEAWEKCLLEEKVPYVTALVKETLRFWTVIPICLPRVNIKDIPYEGAVIPAGTTFFMNAWAADYDETHYTNADQFNPERFLGDAEVGTPHYGYGAGSRMCAGSHLGNRELYTAFIRLITAFEILPAKNPVDQPILNALECNAIPTSLTTEPKPFKVGLKVRDEPSVRRWIAESKERTRDL
ncbi:cytochrome P450 [Thozetella sp. PMI_491]|nr:cytochrome P450 [Thozetella sp. PMI_491]